MEIAVEAHGRQEPASPPERAKEINLPLPSSPSRRLCRSPASVTQYASFFLSFIEEQDTRFTADDFETEMFLGTGSFGRVTLVTFKDR